MSRTGSRISALCAIAAFAGCAHPTDLRSPSARCAGPEGACTAPADRAAQDQVWAAALERRADAHADVGQRDLAAPLYSRAIETRAATSEPPAPVAHTLAGLAVIEHDRGHLPEAEHFYQRALAVDEGDANSDSALRVRVLANLGSLLRGVGRNEEAVASLGRALELLGGDSAAPTAELGWLLGESAAAHAALGQTGAAADTYRRALAVWERLAPESDMFAAETLANLALIHRARGERELAGSLLERALPLYEQSLGADDPTVQRVRSLLAETAAPVPAAPAEDADPAALARRLDREGATLLERGDYDRARPLLERAVAIHERGVTAPIELGASLSYLGRVYAGQRENGLARRTLERALQLVEPELGKLDPLTLATRAALENARAQAPADTP